MQEMIHRLLMPNVVSHNAAISACEKGKHWEGALRLLQEMLHRSLTPNVVSHSAAISACEKGKHWEEALGFAEGDGPQIAHARCGKPQWSHQRVWEGQALGGGPRFAAGDVPHVRRVACMGKHWKEALGLQQEMLRRSLVPTVTG